MRKIRRANTLDAKAIHDAHMRSIQEVCGKDYTPKEINAWGFRPFREADRLNSIQNQFVWVVENGTTIEGYGHLGFETKGSERIAHLYGLYLAPEAIGQGLGSQIVQEIIAEARAAGATKINLESTLTAHAFYKRMGFDDSGAQMEIAIGGVGIRCFPMSMRLAKG